MNLTDKDTITGLLKKHGLWAKKKMGQNFLIDSSALKKITEAADITKADHIIEVGPGLGVLTNELASQAASVQSIELDSELFPLLGETLSAHDNIELLLQDALTFTPPSKPYKVVANIPYNITSPLINHFLRAENKPSTITMLIQKEVAEKICKKEPNMTVLSLQVHLFGTPEYIATVPSESFHPAPKVESAIIHIALHTPNHPDFTPLDKALEILKLSKRAFLNRRKKLSNSLPEFKEPLNTLNFAELRAQNLSIRDWKTLLKALEN